MVKTLTHFSINEIFTKSKSIRSYLELGTSYVLWCHRRYHRASLAWRFITCLISSHLGLRTKELFYDWLVDWVCSKMSHSTIFQLYVRPIASTSGKCCFQFIFREDHAWCLFSLEGMDRCLWEQLDGPSMDQCLKFIANVSFILGIK